MLQLWGIDLSSLRKKKLVVPPNAGDTEDNLSLEEKVCASLSKGSLRAREETLCCVAHNF